MKRKLDAVGESGAGGDDAVKGVVAAVRDAKKGASAVTVLRISSCCPLRRISSQARSKMQAAASHY